MGGVRPKQILIVDDEPEHCLFISQALTAAGYQTSVTNDGPKAVALTREQRFDLYLLDIRMEPMDGLKVLEEIRNLQPEAQAIILSAFGDVDTAVKCMKLGAYDFLAKPINLDELVITVANALKSVELQQEVNTLRTQIEIRQ
ncbi:MAG: response regulator, partial [Candidatus Firestonebacteria bacterium]|nr:response regulator [Candidatus Firestonebacteria bacterium]